MINPNALASDLSRFVSSWGAAGDFNDLALRLFAYQYGNNAPYRRFCDAQGRNPGTVEGWNQIPSAPAEAFRAQVLSCCATEPAALFYTSGTTIGAAAKGMEESRGRGVHRMDALALEFYRLSLHTAFRRLAARASGLPLRALLAPYHLAPHSSLSYMVSALASEAEGKGAETDHRFFWKEDGPNLEGAWSCLSQDTTPVLLFTTAFALLELLEWNGEPLPLPPGSMVIETGGFKGRSRSVDREELYGLAASRFQIPLENIGSEYGMCEMASQFYDRHLGGGRAEGWVGGRAEGQSTPGPILVPPELGGWGPEHPPNTDLTSPPAPLLGKERGAERYAPNTQHPTPIKIGPPWVRTVIIDPVTGQQAAPGMAGILRHYDLCNFNSVQAITTADMGLPVEGTEGFILQGRLSSAPPRGCSLTIEEWMERRVD